MIIAITWEHHRRMEGLCAALGVPLHVLNHRSGGLRRYVNLSIRTVALLLKKRPATLLVQNPSLVLTALAVILRPVLRYRLIVDAHNEAVEPYIHTSWGVPRIARWLLRRADLTIVTNAQLEKRAAAKGGRVMVLPDPLPHSPVDGSRIPALEGALHVMVVSTYAPDEPIAEILEAARQVGGAYRFSVTGRDSKLSSSLRAKLPENVTLTGFLSEDDYWALMVNSHVVLDLTTMPDCLVCGAYEALAAGRPMILSDNAATHALFGTVAVTAQCSTQSIADALSVVRARYQAFAAQMAPAQMEFQRKWALQAAQLTNYMRTGEPLGIARI